MMSFVKRMLARLPWSRSRPKILQVSHTPSQALRQLIRRYMRQKRLWIYVILSSVSLVVMYVLFGLLWAELWHGGGVIPVAWIIVTGVGIAIYQVRRCNAVILTLRQAYTVQTQIEKAEAEKKAQEEAEKAQGQVLDDVPRLRTTNGSQRPSEFPDD